ncbi:MAG: hypothetical protein ACRDBQ_09545 [Shewanella sp.]
MEQLERCSVAQSAECTQIAVKKCTKCKIEKPATTDFFAKASRRKDGLQCWCKSCKSERYQKEKDKVKNRTREWAKNNKDRYDKYREDNRDRYRELKRNNSKKHRIKIEERRKEKYRLDENLRKMASKRATEWARNNRALVNHRQQERNAKKLMATPPWYKDEIDEIAEIYKKAHEIGAQVDHIVPLQSDIVCGLHCICNMQILSKEDNASKGNRWWPDMP